jgi:Cu(I)/Ag(I) efflux system membrane fusion protein
MNASVKIGIVVALIIAAFIAGQRSRSPIPPAVAADGGRRILYYQDPMHPAYKSDKPGVAPDCGMQLEPVYEDDRGDAPARGAVPPGSVQITSGKQQLIGLRVAEVLKAGGGHAVRVLGLHRMSGGFTG